MRRNGHGIADAKASLPPHADNGRRNAAADNAVPKVIVNKARLHGPFIHVTSAGRFPFAIFGYAMVSK